MQKVILLLVALALLLNVLTVLPPSQHANSRVRSEPSPRTSWRQTTQGWQRMDRWLTVDQRNSPSTVRHIHPVMFGLFLLMLSLAALFAFPPRRPAGPQKDSSKEVRVVERLRETVAGSRSI